MVKWGIISGQSPGDFMNIYAQETEHPLKKCFHSLPNSLSESNGFRLHFKNILVERPPPP